MAAIERIDPLQTIDHFLYPREHDPWPKVFRNILEAVDGAREMTNNAMHYAGINVGTMGFAINLEGDFAHFRAANQNFLPGQNDSKFCAEELFLQKVIEHCFSHVPYLATSGPPQPDTHSGHQSDTLCNCGNCRARFKLSKLIHPTETLSMTVHPTKDVFEVYQAGELDGLHAQENPDFVVYKDRGFKGLAGAGERYERLRRRFEPSGWLALIAMTSFNK